MCVVLLVLNAGCRRWPNEWPNVGGGGASTLQLNDDELFARMIEWDNEDYIMGAGTAGSDTDTHQVAMQSWWCWCAWTLHS